MVQGKDIKKQNLKTKRLIFSARIFSLKTTPRIVSIGVHKEDKKTPN